MIPATAFAHVLQQKNDLAVISQGHGWMMAGTKCEHNGEVMFLCTSRLFDYGNGKSICVTFKADNKGKVWPTTIRPLACPNVA